MINETSYIGEVGLDFSKEGLQTKEEQLEVFTKILSIIRTNASKKILSLHSRGAEREVLNSLINNKIRCAIFHWYSGSLNLIDDILKAGYFFSINTQMIKSKKGNEIIKQIPLERLLIESDGPYIESRGIAIKPYELKPVYNFLANQNNISVDRIEVLIKQNFFNLISSLKPD